MRYQYSNDAHHLFYIPTIGSREKTKPNNYNLRNPKSPFLGHGLMLFQFQSLPFPLQLLWTEPSDWIAVSLRPLFLPLSAHHLYVIDSLSIQPGFLSHTAHWYSQFSFEYVHSTYSSKHTHTELYISSISPTPANIFLVYVLNLCLAQLSHPIAHLRVILDFSLLYSSWSTQTQPTDSSSKIAFKWLFPLYSYCLDFDYHYISPINRKKSYILAFIPLVSASFTLPTIFSLLF